MAGDVENLISTYDDAGFTPQTEPILEWNQHGFPVRQIIAVTDGDGRRKLAWLE